MDAWVAGRTDPDWIITGRFEAFDADEALALGTVRWREHSYLSPGVVHFEHDGTPYALQVIVGGGRRTTAFADTTSGDITYPAGVPPDPGRCTAARISRSGDGQSAAAGYPP